ncbi:hypothetical protein [Streptomyces sp. NPDC005476]|uniref:hypothetical protein n=1 Tax=Streptomyces sp. NPDC005476 TaxID=3156882 RepID=UPI003451777B
MVEPGTASSQAAVTFSTRPAMLSMCRAVLSMCSRGRKNYRRVKPGAAVAEVATASRDGVLSG